MSKTTNKFSPEVRQRAIRMVLDHEAEHPSRWAAVSSIAGKIGCSPATLHEWVYAASTPHRFFSCSDLRLIYGPSNELTEEYLTSSW